MNQPENHLPKPKRAPWGRMTLLGLFGIVLIAALSGFGGWQSGISARKVAAVTQQAGTLRQQFELGAQDLAMGAYDRARQRFEYIIRIDPSYPGVTEALAEVLLRLNSTATPTVQPTPTVTPTPDSRGVEERYSQVQTMANNGDWTGAIDTALALRKVDPNYRAVELDGILFIGLRNRGIDKIGKQADLEGGLYDLSLAERFGPLDSEAQGYRNWARLYLTGASFWDLDWEQAVFYFEQIAPQLPNLRDGSGLTAMERYRQALIGWGDQLSAAGDCSAAEKYEQALAIADDAHASEALAKVVNSCEGGGEGEQPAEGEQPTLEATATPEGELPPVDATPSEAPPTEAPPAVEPTIEPTPGG